jgi:zinc protease
MSPVSGRNVFGLSGRFLAKDFDRSLDLLRALLTGTMIREDELAKVKGEILSELRRRDDEPLQYTFTLLNRELYDGHPYAMDQIGDPQDVANLKAADIKQLYEGFVTPNGAVLALSGDIEPARSEALVRRLLSDWKGPEHPLRKQTHTLAAGREKTVEREMLQTHLIFSFAGPGLIEADRYPVEVMNAILSGMGGRIHRKLREENPYAYAVTFFNQEAYETGAIGIYIGTDRSYAADVERVSREEIEKIRQEGFSEEEVASAKRYMIGNHYIRMQTNGAIASSMCLDAIYGLSPGFFKVWPEQAEKVTKDQVNGAARAYLLLDRMVKIEVGPGTGKGAQ